MHSSVVGHLDCFHVLAIVSSAVVNIGVHMFFPIRVFVFSGYMPRSGMAGSYGSSTFKNFLRSLLNVDHSGCYQLIVPPTVQESSLLFTPSVAFVICRLFNDQHSDQCEVITSLWF